MRPPSKQPPLPPKAIYGQLQALLGARRKRTVAELRRAGVPTRDAAGVLAAESAAIRKLGIDLARHGVLQAVRQSPVFSAPVPGNAQGMFKSAVDLWVADTEKLFVSSSADLVREANALVLAGRASGKTNAEIGAEIAQRLQYAERRARFIAEQQADMLAARALELRHQAAGVTEFIWNTQRDSIVRAEHRAWHGKKFRYSAPPDGTLPGIPPRCRCFAVPVIPDYLPTIGETRVFDPRSDPTPLGPDPLGWLQ